MSAPANGGTAQVAGVFLSRALGLAVAATLAATGLHNRARRRTCPTLGKHVDAHPDTQVQPRIESRNA